jgi:O-antigen/teichoic acid export membrane protein
MKNNVPRSVLFGFLSTLLPLVSTFVVTPFVVRGLGTQEFGLFALVVTFISYSFNFGIGRAVVKYIAEYRAKGDVESVSDVLAANLFLNLTVGIAGAIILILLTKTLVQDVLLIEFVQQSRAVTGFYIAAATVVFLMVQQVFSSVLQAVGKYDWFSHITTVVSTILSAGNLALVFFAGDAVALLWWNLAVTILGAAAFFLAARKSLPEAHFKLGFRWNSLKQVAGFSLFIFSYQISANIWFVVERSWITRDFGTENLTFYVVTMALAMYIHTFVISLSLVLMPLTSELATKSDNLKLLGVYERATKYIALIVVFVCASLCVGSKAFLTLWLGADFAEKASLILILHVITYCAMGISIVAWQINEGLGFPRRSALMVLGWLIGGLVLLSILTPLFGLNGAALARTAVVVLSLPVYIVLTERAVFDKVNWTFWQKSILSLILASAAGGAAIYFLLERLPLSWVTFLFSNLVGGAVYLAILFLTRYLTIEEQQWLRRFANRAIAAN